MIITDEHIEHIERRHPGDYKQYHDYLADMVLNPDYILQDDRQFTAMVLKEFYDAGTEKHFRLALRLRSSDDMENFQNSIITFMKIRDKEVTFHTVAR